MPRRYGTGPMRMGAMTESGKGFCNTDKDINVTGGRGIGLGLGCKRGIRRNCFSNAINSENEKDLLIQQKAILEERLNLLNNKLNKLKDEN